MTSSDLKNQAEATMMKAYSPYSNFKVGAAIRTAAGHVYSGCNVENASYGLSICAERNAIMQAVAAEGPAMKLAAVVVTNYNQKGESGACSPCGACRQFMIEFATKDTTVTYPGTSGDIETTADKLLPDSFSF